MTQEVGKFKIFFGVISIISFLITIIALGYSYYFDYNLKYIDIDLSRFLDLTILFSLNVFTLSFICLLFIYRKDI